ARPPARLVVTPTGRSRHFSARTVQAPACTARLALGSFQRSTQSDTCTPASLKRVRHRAGSGAVFSSFIVALLATENVVGGRRPPRTAVSHSVPSNASGLPVES